MRQIVAHSELLPQRVDSKTNKPKYNDDCNVIALVEWEDGQRSWEDPRIFDRDQMEITVAAHARENDLLFHKFWKRYQHTARREKKMR